MRKLDVWSTLCGVNFHAKVAQYMKAAGIRGSRPALLLYSGRLDSMTLEALQGTRYIGCALLATVPASRAVENAGNQRTCSRMSRSKASIWVTRRRRRLLSGEGIPLDRVTSELRQITQKLKPSDISQCQEARHTCNAWRLVV
jgi:hypothetical protein